MNDRTSVGKRVQNLQIGPEFDTYTKVIIHAGQITDADGNTTDLDYVAGEAGGRTLEIDDLMGTQQKADALLAKLQNSKWQYQPYTGDKALLDPAAELGDGLTISDTFSAIYRRKVKFGSLMAADVEAPSDEEIDHEFPYIPKEDREYKRETAFTRSQLKINANEITAEISRATTEEGKLDAKITVQADRITTEVSRIDGVNATQTSQINQNATAITARVTKTGGNNSSFGWSLQNDNFSLFSGNKNVFKCTASGIEVDGKITARSGYIGNGSSGFTITNTSIYNGVTSISDAAHDGVYVGTDGIRLGKGVFSVSKAGKVDASNLNITGGSISIKNGTTETFKVTNVGKVTASDLNITGGSISIKSGNTVTFSVSSAGAVKATSGTVGGFTLGDSKLYNGKSTLTAGKDGVYIGTDGISLGTGSKFKVTNAGVLTAENATIKGTISATGGSVGGFTIASSKLYTGEKSSLDADKSGVYIGTDGISLGYKNNFKVTSGGSLTARSGEIGGFKITSSALYKDKTSYAATGNGVYIGTTGIALGDNFKVDTGGNVTAKNMTISGTLKVGGSSISAESLYTGASQAANNYNTWSGTSTTVSNNSSTWTTGASNGTTAKGKWDSAENENVGVTIYGSFRGAITASNGLWMPYGYGTRQVGITSVTIGGRSYNILIV